jgi:O-antigen/teichoic acid export membrane protein
MIKAARRVAFLRLLSSAVTMQALLSGSSFLVGLILIRRTSDTQYGYYVLVTNAVLLLTLLQQSFIQPQLITRMPACDLQQRAAMVGGLYRDQRRWWPALAGFSGGIGIVLRLCGIIDNQMLFIVLTGTAALSAALFREFFRIVLLSHRRPGSVLRADAVYVVLLVAGAWIASTSALPAAFATLTLSIAAAVGGFLCTRSLWRFEAWDIRGAPGILRQIAPLGLWAAGGTITHWLFSQGYSYLVAGTLDVAAVAAIAATRLLTMPINLLSTGLGSMMLPSISAWLHSHSTRKVFGRQILFSMGLAALSLVYLTAIWIFRDWIFLHVFKKHSPSFDTLLLLWSLVVLVMMFRDQLVYLLVVRGRFRSLAVLTLGSAVVALLLSYAAMLRHGVAGALGGVLVGELLNVSGIIYLCLRETRQVAAAPVTETL